MFFQDLFEQFSQKGHLCLPEGNLPFADKPWVEHQAFAGVALKELISGRQTGGKFSYHLVRIKPNCKIGNHIHKAQLETHEVIAGSGMCINNGVEMPYTPGVIAIIQPDLAHEVCAGPEGLYLFAKFIPALA